MSLRYGILVRLPRTLRFPLFGRGIGGGLLSNRQHNPAGGGGLLDELYRAHYRPDDRHLTPRQVQIIYAYLGEPFGEE